MVSQAPFLAFDERYRHPREEFFHFLWGYLLPALYWISHRPDPSQTTVRMVTCGPLMDPLAAEAIGMLGAKVEILADPPADEETVFLPRWDMALYRNLELFVPIETDTGVVPRALRIAAERFRRPKSLPRPFELLALRKRITSVRNRLLPAALEIGLDRGAHGKVLILKRSEPPEFYKDGCGAKKKGYGTSRRALIGIEQAAAELERRGVPVAIFEPGGETLATQIRAFHKAAGLVGIRGSEFANLIWMKRGAQGVMLTPRSMQRTHRLPKMISEVAEVSLVEMEVDSDFPVLEAEKVLPFFLAPLGVNR